ncbi:MAG TPA: prenyltransferase/squalene oxidase repeat-containing protein [Allosphingosinicella sp.]|nr:prenyltransferase/squalene oxidase repeat-containing protein [Allosphingosinicella sp.]
MSLVEEPDSDLSPLGSLALLWPAVADALVSPAARSRLETAAGRLAPIARLALELRLGEGRDEVDLHQYVSRSGADVAALRRHLSRSGRPSAGEEPARRFLDAWVENDEAIRSDFDGFFLEWDGPGPRSAAPPAIFLPVQARHDPEVDPTESRGRVAAHVERLGLAGAHVASLLSAIPADLSISYVGFMIGRGEAVRLNLRSIRPDDLPAVLARLGWPGDGGRATALFRRLVALTGQSAVALDFDPAIKPTIGFECVLPHLPAEEPRWLELLDWLCAEGLCTREKRAALERVGGRIHPEEEGQAWPASWIAAAVGSPRQFVPWFERRLSHVKVSIGADGKVSAKAYVSAQHHWSRGGMAERPAAEGRSSRSPAAAIRSAARFLIAARQQDDFWRDFRLVNGESDEWVTAFVGYALVKSGVPLPAGLVPETVRALLGRQRAEGGWGYNRISPADSDSTAWVLKFLAAAEVSGPPTESAKAFLLSHLRPEGGLSTYAPATRLLFGGAPAADDSGWRSGHPCVAANAAGLIGEPLTAHLLSIQGADGAWPAYWWRDDALSTALASESLEAIEGAAGSRSSAAAWAALRSPSATGVFERAWLIQAHGAGGSAERARAREMALALAAEQRPDGGWDSSAEMLFPDPARLHREAGATVVRDQNRLFTAASALLALESTFGDGR